MENILARMREMQVKDNKQRTSSTPKEVMDKLVADLKAQSAELKRQGLASKQGSGFDGHKEADRSSGSDPFTPATDTFDVVSSAEAKESRFSVSSKNLPRPDPSSIARSKNLQSPATSSTPLIKPWAQHLKQTLATVQR
jgi:hypothetical protein